MAAKSRSDCNELVKLKRRLRRPVRGRDKVRTDDRIDELSEEILDEDEVALAHREIASSTIAAMAVNRPPNRDEPEDDEEGAIDIGLGTLGGGSPRKMSASSLSSTESWGPSY